MNFVINITNTYKAIKPILSFLKEILKDYNFSENELYRFLIAVNEALTDSIKYAYPDETGNIEVRISIENSFIEVSIHDYGQPFDITKYDYSPEKAKNGDFSGSGLKLIKSFADDFIFINLGKNGKEFRLIKNFPYIHISKEFEEKSEKSTYEGLYQIDFVKEEYAEDISKLIYRAYGLTYPKEDMYYPEKIKKEIKENKKFGVILKTKDGEVVGYFAILKSTDSNIGEVGEAVVHPNHRGKGLMNIMMKALIDMAIYRGLLGLFGEAVSVHTISQKVNAKFGFVSTALLIGIFPYVEWKGFKQKNKESL